MSKLKLSPTGKQIILYAIKNRGFTRSDSQLLTSISNILEPRSSWPQVNEDDGTPLYAFALQTWQRFLIGQNVNAELVKATCQVLNLNWQEVVEPDSAIELAPQQAEFRSAQQTWIDRANITKNLLHRLQSDCRILLLTGLTGIGKTAISLYLGEQLTQIDWPDNLILRINPDDGLDFSQFAAYCLRSWQQPCPEADLQKPDRLLNRMMAALVDRPIVIQLHSFEYCLQGNEARGWNEFIDPHWMEFFDRCLMVPGFAARLIISSQDLPSQFRARSNSSHWYCCPVDGLEPLQQLRLFQQRGIDVSPESPGRPHLERIGRAYEGHPLALQIIASEILDESFAGDVCAYWQKYGKEIATIEKAAQQAAIEDSKLDHKLHRYSKSLRQRVKERIEATLKRLETSSPSAYVLLCHGSVFNRPVPPRFWARNAQTIGYLPEQVAQGLELLIHRYLIELQDDPFTEEDLRVQGRYTLKLHNLIRSVAREHLKQLRSHITP